MSVIIVKDLGKAYRQYPKRWSRLVEWLSPFQRAHHNLKWVMRDISFTVKQGDAVGIIGINGAGKSTLLKMITGTAQPTTGTVTMHGRVAALLELGMGFHPDFTGRQNAVMSCQLLGYTIEEINQLMPGIEAFAEIGDYIDQPVRVYSSGMQVRLAFSVATARRPDVLIVDEALSVGDTYFQHKSFLRIREFKSAGTTLLFVSHDLAAMRVLCEQCIWLDSGNVRQFGDSKNVIDSYESSIYRREQKLDELKVISPPNELMPGKNIKKDFRQELIKNSNLRNDLISFDFNKVAARWGDGRGSIENVYFTDHHGKHLTSIVGGEDVLLRIECAASMPIATAIIGFMVKDRLGQNLFGDNNYLSSLNNPIAMEINDNVIVNFSFIMPYLPNGLYSITAALISGTQQDHKVHVWMDNALYFESHNGLSLNGIIGIPIKNIDIKLIKKNYE